MKISSNLTNDELEKLQDQFYSYFKNGYEFEDFLKEYLIKMGLDEVQTTQRSRDGGIDLTAIRKGVGDFSEIDTTHYYIQAKCYALKNKVSVHAIRELKGTIPFGYKGMLITTSDFTSDALAEAVNDPSKPVVAINGKALIMSCIDNQIGFIFKPVFSSKQLDLFLNKHSESNPQIVKFPSGNAIEKTITSNDIRSRIISIPSAIMKQFTDDQEYIKVLVNGEKEYKLKICRGRNYLGGVTKLLNDYKLLDEGVITAKKSKWLYEQENFILKINIED